MITLTFQWHSADGPVDIEVFFEERRIQCVVVRREGKPVELTLDEIVAIRKMAVELIGV